MPSSENLTERRAAALARIRAALIALADQYGEPDVIPGHWRSTPNRPPLTLHKGGRDG